MSSYHHKPQIHLLPHIARGSHAQIRVQFCVVPELTLFISHRTSDAKLAKAVTELFEKSLKLPARQIRCTSVDGYRLPVGADTDEQLRREVFDARAFIGLITPVAVESPYVMFELGARWGAKRHLAPVLARGADSSYLGGPLAGINAIRLGERNHVVQLVEDISEYLNMLLEPAASFQAAIDAVVSAASEPSTRIRTRASVEEPPSLEEIEIRMLEVIAHDPPQRPHQLAQALKLPLEKTNYHLHRLLTAGMLEINHTPYGETYYRVQQRGRALLVERGLL